MKKEAVSRRKDGLTSEGAPDPPTGSNESYRKLCRTRGDDWVRPVELPAPVADLLQKCGFSATLATVFAKEQPLLIDGEWVWPNDTRASTHLGVEVFLSWDTCREALTSRHFLFC